MILTVIWYILTELKAYMPEGFLDSRPLNKSKEYKASSMVARLLIGLFSIVGNQEERSKSVHFQRQKKIKGYADFCCEKYMELL